MTKTELQVALAAATETSKSDQKERRVRLARLWEARKAEKEGSNGLQSKDAAENQDSSKDRC
jgi:hypothetical protein